MEYLLIFLSITLMIAGLLGCILPVLPGPPLAFIGLIVLGCCPKIEFSWVQYTWWGSLTVAVTAFDFIVPMIGAKMFKSSIWGSRGSFIGTIIGLFFLPAGIIFGPFLGAVVGEMLGGKDGSQALKSGIGSLIGFMFGTGLKFMVCAYFIYIFIKAIVLE